MNCIKTLHLCQFIFFAFFIINLYNGYYFLEKKLLSNLPKLVVSDIGGTLIGDSSIIPEFTGKTFAEMTKRDIPVVLITGFNYHTTKAYAKNLDRDTILMPQNGTLCLKKDEVIWEYGIDADPVKEIYDFLDKEQLPIIIYKGIEDNFEVQYLGRGFIERGYPFVEIDNLDNYNNITGISTIIPFDKIDMISSKVKNIIGNKFQMIRVKEEKHYWLEITPKNVRKDLAIKRFCEENSISLSDVIFFGDNYNDLELLRIVGTPVIVENAVIDLKNEFANICKPVYEEGVAIYLQELFKLKNEK